MLLKDFEHRVRLSVSHHAPYVNLIRLACVRTQHSGVSGTKRCPKLPAALPNSLRLFGCETELGKLHNASRPLLHVAEMFVLAVGNSEHQYNMISMPFIVVCSLYYIMIHLITFISHF